MSQSNLIKFLIEDKVKNASNEELSNMIFEVECQCMDPRSKHYNTFQTVTNMLVEKYDGEWDKFVDDDPDGVKAAILKFG